MVWRTSIPAGSGTVFVTPDNIAVDHFGNAYLVEDDEPFGGDIWKAIDADRDGVAEAMGIFLSLGISGSEPTGLIFAPADPYRCIVNVQHPGSGNDAVQLRLDSPNGSLCGAPFAMLLQGFATGTGVQPFLPPLWVNPRNPIVVVTGGPTGQFGTVLPQGGYSIALQVPPGLFSLSVLVQGMAASDGALVMTDADEVVLK